MTKVIFEEEREDYPEYDREYKAVSKSIRGSIRYHIE